MKAPIARKRAILFIILMGVVSLFADLTYEGKNISKPPYWGGYRLLPESFEFWQGRTNRFHHRFRYHLVGDNQGQIYRLAP
jgi:pyridoxine/pyridoxamine 5'-phosphate oxidase